MNPAAGRGLARRRIEAARLALSRVGPFDMVTTAHPGDEARLAADAVRDGVAVLAVLGGDGTLHQVCAPLAGTPCALAIFAAGTGNDFAKALGTPSRDFAAMAARIALGHTRQVDLGDVNGRVFVNALGVGFDVAVLQQQQRTRWLHGHWSYAAAAVRQLQRYQGFAAEIDVPGATSPSPAASDWLMLVVATGAHFGGMFRIAPAATVADGRLDLVAVRDVSPWRRVQLLAAAPRGSHVRAPEVLALQHERFVLRFTEPPWFEADGELYLADGPALHLSTRARALRVVV